MTSTLTNVSARRIVLALYQLDLPAVHPDSAAGCVESIIDDKSSLGKFIETDPAAAIAFINLCRQNNIEFSFDNLNFQQLINKIPSQKLLKMFLNIKTFDLENLHSQIPIAEMNKTSAARAFAARLIAAKTAQANENLSFIAGLLADIGLFALAELYPKSLLMFLEESKARSVSLFQIEKENLGTTHNVLSRQLAQKWNLPQAVADSAFLYSSPAAEKIDNLSNIEIVLTVRLADMLVKSITSDESITVPAKLSLNAQDLNAIKDELKKFIAEIDVEISQPQKLDAETIKQVCLSLLENTAEQKLTDFYTAVSNSLNPASSAIEIAAVICRQICKTLNAEKASIFLSQQNSKQYETVTSAGDSLQFSIIDNPPSAEGANNVKYLKLQSGNNTVGGMFLQVQQDSFLSDQSSANTLAAFVAQLIAIKLAGLQDQTIAQAVIDNFDQSPKESPKISYQSTADLCETIAEIAAGAAHELNNPLAVISGRAQLLSQSETDETKKIILNQITEKTKDAYEIVGQLMSYARPAKPQTRTVSPFIMINNCLEKVNVRYLSEPLDIKLENIENLNDIEVDPEQIAEAIAQIIYNALESYESGNGPVQIIGGEQKEKNLIEISIKDSGCGMSPETLQKASEPFYSDKPAGRQRGMGLALASSMLKNNGCTVNIQSQLDKGTTVTILLPKSSKSENS
ncbi:MAG: HDOD domain-containing protein [Sedimentisphaerales bacterium]|jgi:signal transduction histidine kinase